MSLIIKGVDMPKSGESMTYFSKEIIEIPRPHGRLIDADRLLAVLKSMSSTSEYVPAVAVLDLIDHQPVVVEAEKGDENV